MQKSLCNYAFIDGTNLHRTMQEVGWKLDLRRFRIYLKEHYGVVKVYYFIGGYLKANQALYDYLRREDYEIIFKPLLKLPDGTLKGNCDAELVLQAMIDLRNYEKAIIISSDGDFYCLVKYLYEQNKLLTVLAPCKAGLSHLLDTASRGNVAYLDNLRQKLAYK